MHGCINQISRAPVGAFRGQEGALYENFTARIKLDYFSDP